MRQVEEARTEAELEPSMNGEESPALIEERPGLPGAAVQPPARPVPAVRGTRGPRRRRRDD